MDDRVPTFITKARSLRKQYVDHVRNYNGLGIMLAGAIYVMIGILNCFIRPGVLADVLTIALVLVWTFSKEVIQRKCYTDFEPIREPISRFTSLVKKLPVVGMIGFALVIWTYLILNGKIHNLYLWPSLLVISGLYRITWWFLRTPIDFVIGFYLWFLCAAAINGQPLGLSAQDLASLLMIGVILVPFGLWLHLDYVRIVRATKELRHVYY